MLSVRPLSQQPTLKPLVSSWLLSEWPTWYGEGGEGNLEGDIEAFAASEHQLPVGLVAFLGETPIAFGSLKRESIKSHPHLFPWAASGYVLPVHRGQGVGAFLLRGLSAQAHRLGYQQVYCGTSTATSLLVRAGWHVVEQVQHVGKPLTIFRSGA
ncbi:MAG: GNAT family N-acetyltransferase [Betaproteobacteria bacterium]|nr:GNAT family N-acetyltransferase [Betaproteobacteria bacterium]